MTDFADSHRDANRLGMRAVKKVRRDRRTLGLILILVFVVCGCARAAGSSIAAATPAPSADIESVATMTTTDGASEQPAWSPGATEAAATATPGPTATVRPAATLAATPRATVRSTPKPPPVTPSPVPTAAWQLKAWVDGPISAATGEMTWHITITGFPGAEWCWFAAAPLGIEPQDINGMSSVWLLGTYSQSATYGPGPVGTWNWRVRCTDLVNPDVVATGTVMAQ